MGNSFYWWSKYDGKRSNGDRGRRPKGRGPGPGWEPVMPLEVKHGFFTNYKVYLGASTLCLVSSLWVLASVWRDLFLLGGGAPLYFFLLGAGILMGLVLPPFWYCRYRRMMRIVSAPDDEVDALPPAAAEPPGFFETHQKELLRAAAVGVPAWSVFGLLFANLSLREITAASIFGSGYIVLLFLAAVGSILLPVVWFARHKRFVSLSHDEHAPLYDMQTTLDFGAQGVSEAIESHPAPRFESE